MKLCKAQIGRFETLLIPITSPLPKGLRAQETPSGSTLSLSLQTKLSKPNPDSGFEPGSSGEPSCCMHPRNWILQCLIPEHELGWKDKGCKDFPASMLGSQLSVEPKGLQIPRALRLLRVFGSSILALRTLNLKSSDLKINFSASNLH